MSCTSTPEERKEQPIAATVELMRCEGVQSVTVRAIAKKPASLLAEIELILWATRNAPTSPLAAKIYPAYETEPGNRSPKQLRKSLIDFPTLARSFLMIYDGAAIQYLTNPKATDHRTMFFTLVDALLTKAGV